MKTWKIITILILLALLVLAAVYLLPKGKTPPSTGLSEEEKAKILEDLAKESQPQMSDKEKENILQNLSKQSGQELSDEEKARLLESLSQ